MPKFTASLNVPKYSSTPGSAQNGDVYYNTTSNILYGYIGGTWTDLAATGGGGGGGTSTIAESVRAAVRNVTGSTIAKGSIVYLSGVNGEKPTIAKALAGTDATSASTFGWVENAIDNNSDGYVTTFGILNNVDTQAYSDGQYLYLSGTTAGAATATKPYAPTHNVTVGFVVKGGSVGAGQVFVLLKNGFELEELHDVQVNGAASGTYLKYNGSLWVADDQVVTLTGTQTVTNKTLTDPQVTGKIIIDNNGATPFNLSNASGTTIQAVSNDGADTRVVLDAHGTGVHGALTIRSSRGTGASPSAVQSGDKIGEMGARGYGATGFSTSSVARVAMYANENWTDTAQATKVTIEATESGAAAAEQVATFTAGSGGGMSLLAGREVKINGNSVLSSNTLGSGVVNSSLTSVGTISTGSWQGTAVGVAYGGTGATDAQGARTAVLPAQTSANNKFLRSDGTDVSWQTALTSVANETIDGGNA